MPLFFLVTISHLVCSNSFADDSIDFNRDVKPILSNRCYLCHGPDESSREADLRLDSFEAATEYAIEPGEFENSEVYLRIASTDGNTRMPPSEHGPSLTEAEKKIIKNWISQGAKYDKHWSYKKPHRVTQNFKTSDWNQNNIDGYVLHSMTQKGLSPTAPADRYSIIRRVALDLTGLPPTLEEADRFINDQTDGAYERMVNYYISSEAFGERWASVWLDQARYADSMGYAEDRNRAIWAYRDYVIRAINKNMPFDQFTIEQLAGDLLDNPTEDQLIATAFHRNTLTNTEGGTIDEEFRSAAIVDRTNTTMAVWMGTTMACAQCHTHKYDPITQDEYFQFYAFFNSTADNDLPSDAPRLDLFNEKQKQQIAAIKSDIGKLKQEIANWDKKPVEIQLAELKDQREAWIKDNESLTTNVVEGSIIRVDLPKDNAFLSLAEVQVFVGEENVALAGKAKQSTTAYSGPAEKAIDGNTDGNLTKNKSVTHTARQKNPWWEVQLEKPYPLDKIVVWNRKEKLHSRLDGAVISVLNEKRNTVWKKTIEAAKPKPEEFVLQLVSESVFEALTSESKTEDQLGAIADFHLQNFNPTIELKKQVATYETKLQKIRPYTTVPIQQELVKPRETYVHIRGSYLSKGNTVERGTPQTFHPYKSNQKSRLDLAKWIVSQENPLTARVVVNRFWQQLFGIGIVATSEEFGSQGELPTHPELLDYLACEFMEKGWDVKRIIKLMVMSSTYRQASIATPQKMELDPNNRWLSRGPRFRLTAEMVRDQALLSSGLLSYKLYGPPVQPPQPKMGLKIAFRPETADWEDSVGEDRYRRAIYTRWRRTSPYPSMTTFDISNREVCELRRLRTNTPLQALVTLNDPVFVEAAQALARRIYDKNKSKQEIAKRAFRHALIRFPTQNELSLLVSLFDDAVSHFDKNPEAAQKLAVDPLNPVTEETDFVQLAAWTTVANSILNLDEMFMKR